MSPTGRIPPVALNFDADFFDNLLNGLEDPVFLKDEHHRWVYANKAFCDLVGSEDLIGKTDADYLPSEQCAEFYAGDRFVLKKQKSLTQEEPIGPEVWGLVKKTPILLPDGRKGILGIIIDITEYRSIQLEVEALRLTRRQALHDPLTDLPNRRGLQEYFDGLPWQNGKGLQDVCLMHVDLDGFKRINDEDGHSAGDAILVHVGKLLEASKTDDMFAARIGGDEFVVVLSPSNGTQTALVWAKQFIKALREPIPNASGALTVGASVGIASARDASLDLDALLHASDLALYRAKANGRNRAEVFTPDMQHTREQRRTLERQLAAALEGGRFEPFYQPQFELISGAYAGVEVLARWRHPNGELQQPHEFLPVLEDMRQICALDFSMMEAAFADIRALADCGVDVRRVAFNVSKACFSRADFSDVIASLVRPKCEMAIEFSEAISFEQMDDAARSKIEVVRDLGCAIEIDDFGRDRASLLGVINVQPDRIKLDKQLVMPLAEADDQRAVVSSILKIAQSMNVDVIAEGIESAAHVDILASMGCRYGQGFHYSRPLPRDALEAFLRNTDGSALKSGVA